MISKMVRAMILHASMHLKEGIDSTLWPIAVNSALHIYNNTLKNGVSSADNFNGSTVPRHRLLKIHIWGCLIYILDPIVQHGKKLLRWQPLSRHGINMGLSLQHASDVSVPGKFISNDSQ
jgi:hypothetical protein